MSAAHKASVSEMTFKPKEPRVEYRVLVVKSLSVDLEQIARVNTAINAAVGDETKISVTSMLLDDLKEMRDAEYKSWGGKPVDEESEAELIKRLIEVHRKANPPDDDDERPTKHKKR